jgi:colanic acid/amylovoran biosynthesis glycosyltransferase
MRIAFLVEAFPSMAQTFVLNQILGLIKGGHDVWIFSRKAGKYEKKHEDYRRYNLGARTIYYQAPRRRFVRAWKSVKGIIRHAPKNAPVIMKSLNVFKYGRRALSFALLFEVICFLEKGPFDIVHCQFGTLGMTAVTLRQLGAVNCRIVTSIRGSDITVSLPRRKEVIKELFREGDLFLPVSHSLKEHLVRAGCSEEKIIVHHSGIDCSRFMFFERSVAAGEPVRMLTIGRLVEKKGVAFAIEAIARLISEGRRVSYTVIGDGELRNELGEMIQRQGLTEHVRLVGWKTREQVSAFLEEAHILVAPSVTSAEGDQEGIPNVLKEGMASGLPVVTTLHSGIPELVVNGISGFTVPERDVESLAASLRYLIEHPELWPAMGRSGRSMVEKHFDIEKLIDELVEIYRRLLV